MKGVGEWAYETWQNLFNDELAKSEKASYWVEGRC